MDILNILIIFLGFLFIVQGIIIWNKQIVALTFDYNRRNIKEDDVKQFTASYGKAYIMMGFAMVLPVITQVKYHGYYQLEGIVLFAIAFISAITIIIKTQKKYKTGIFNE